MLVPHPIAQIISGFLSFGSLHIKTKSFEPWQWYEKFLLVLHVHHDLQAYDHYWHFNIIDCFDICVRIQAVG